MKKPRCAKCGRVVLKKDGYHMILANNKTEFYHWNHYKKGYTKRVDKLLRAAK